MKKFAALVILFAVMAGCNKEKIYRDDLNGTWEVYKYLLNNNDKTFQFQNQHPNYTITFTSSGNFVEFETSPDSTFTEGTYSFADNAEKLVLTHTYYTYTIDTAWVDSVTFNFDTVQIPHTVKRPYTIFNLTKTHVQLRNDTSQLYMNKKQ